MRLSYALSDSLVSASILWRPTPARAHARETKNCAAMNRVPVERRINAKGLFRTNNDTGHLRQTFLRPRSFLVANRVNVISMPRTPRRWCQRTQFRAALLLRTRTCAHTRGSLQRGTFPRTLHRRRRLDVEAYEKRHGSLAALLLAIERTKLEPTVLECSL